MTLAPTLTPKQQVLQRHLNASSYQWAAENYGYDGDSGNFDCTLWTPIRPTPSPAK